MTHEYWDHHCGLIGYQPPEKTRYLFASPGSASTPAPPTPPPPSRKTDVGGGSESLPTVTRINKRDVLNANSTTVEPLELVPCITKGSSEVSSLKRKISDQPKDFPSSNPKKARSVGNTGSSMHDNSSIVEPIELVPCLTKGSSEGSYLKRKIPDQPESSPSNNPKTARSVGNTGLNKHDNDNNAHDQRKTSVMQENKKLQLLCLEYQKAEKELNIKVLQLITELGEAQKEYASLMSEWLRLVKV